ncbi:UDP-N-acetylglucosamine 2-epimerase [Teredinibacter waterburyi]|uniref:UDP-N-acetylglucosamine 2-epimerase n=1 Tax=Teredinibacter waterburyi TaxID=1500538 RepID=UPI00165FD6A0|nr:UDP-N-acetylglucosamine 2-epimerase [Teredinibacter waterburyi]
MIHIFLGTKAQLIKMAPIMRELQDRNIEYNFIFSGQHQNTINDLRNNFGVKEPNVILHSGKDINSIPAMLLWMIKIIYRSLIDRKRIWREDRDGIVLNHGDTFSTLLGTILGKLSGLSCGHIESGLRSYNLLHPFPEEITRLLVFKMTDHFFCPGEWAINNVASYNGIKIDSKGNTLYDSLQSILSLPLNPNLPIPSIKFGIVSIHRFENIFSKEKLEFIVNKTIEISAHTKLLFILHSPTEKRLKRYNLYKTLSTNSNIELRPRYDYKDFVTLIQASTFVVSDGGSNQEECFYLRKPCLLMREATERQEGINDNVVISNYNNDTITQFFDDLPNHKSDAPPQIKSPTQVIVNYLSSLTKHQ